MFQISLDRNYKLEEGRSNRRLNDDGTAYPSSANLDLYKRKGKTAASEGEKGKG